MATCRFLAEGGCLRRPLLAVTAGLAAAAATRLVRRFLSTSAPPKLKLTYFDFPGLGDRLRLTLAVGGIDFEDERLQPGEVGQAEVGRRRAALELPFGQVPVVTGINGRTYGQTNALLRYFGRRAGLYPDGLDGLQCDMVLAVAEHFPHSHSHSGWTAWLRPAQVLEAFADIDARLLPQHYGAVMSRSPSTGKPQVPLSAEQRVEVARRLNADVLPTMLCRVEAVLQATNGPWYCGDRLTICDIVSLSVVDGMSDGSYVPGVERSVFDGCPALLEHAERVRALPAVAQWIARGNRWG